jgi:prevent-host-death family protein
MQKVLSVHDAQVMLSQLIERAAAGESVYLGDHGRAQVKLVPVATADRPQRVFGFRKVRLKLPANLDAPLPENLTRSFEGEA